MSGNRSAVVYVIAKAPQAGASKTRLCPPLTPEQAAALATALLRDALDTVESAGYEARILCRDVHERSALEAVIGASIPIVLQLGSGLGDALESAFRLGLAEGFTRVGVFGADSPTIRPRILRDAFAAVRSPTQVALGPTEDGGYYLLVAGDVHAGLFRDIPWSTNAVLPMTLVRCQSLGLQPHFVDRWYDVDDAASLRRLIEELWTAPPGVATHTRALLAELRLLGRSESAAEMSA